MTVLSISPDRQQSALLLACGLLAICCWGQSVRELRRSEHLPAETMAALPAHLIVPVEWSEARAQEPISSASSRVYSLPGAAHSALSGQLAPTVWLHSFGFGKDIATALWPGGAVSCFIDAEPPHLG
jgi:hypothetical protein